MRLEKEYRYIYGVWQYIEKILEELGALLEDSKEAGSESDKMTRIYRAKLPNSTIRVEVVYEKKNVPLISKGFGKIAFTNIKIDVSSENREKEKEIVEYFSERLALYTLRGAG